MRSGFRIALAALLVMTVEPAVAQTPGMTTPPGTQNPAVTQPRLVAPPQAAPAQPYQAYQPGPQPSGPQPGGPQPGEQSPSAFIIPGGAGGLCECVVNHDRSVSPFDKTKMHQSCLSSVEACQSACNTQHSFSFVPHAIYTCPGRGEEPGRVAANIGPLRRLASAR